MRFRAFFCIFILTFSVAFAHEEEEFPTDISVETDSLVYDYEEDMMRADSLLNGQYSTSNQVYPKEFQPNFKNKYKGEEYNYTTIKPKESIWDRIQRRIIKILSSIFGDVGVQKTNGVTFVFLRIFAIVLVGFLLYFLLKYILSKDGNFFFSKKNQKTKIREEHLSENIHEINFSEEILKFEREKNYRYAIRYHFLNILKKLSDAKRIDWVPEKTNRDYISELKNAEQKEDFRELVRIFDYVWYGEFDINEYNYQHFKTVFTRFKI